MYKKVLLAYDGSVEGRRALREGAKLAQLCRSEVFLLAVVEVSSIMTPEAGLTIPIELQTEDYKAILNEGTERLKALGFRRPRGSRSAMPGRKLPRLPKKSARISSSSATARRGRWRAGSARSAAIWSSACAAACWWPRPRSAIPSSSG
jgi:Universal stress protein UspA and related nucleotide-binding proteins